MGNKRGRHAWNVAIASEMEEAERFILDHTGNGLAAYYISGDVFDPPRRMVGFAPGSRSLFKNFARWGGYVVLQPEKPRTGSPEEVFLCTETPSPKPGTSPSSHATPTPSTGLRRMPVRHTRRPSWRVSASASP